MQYIKTKQPMTTAEKTNSQTTNYNLAYDFILNSTF